MMTMSEMMELENFYPFPIIYDSVYSLDKHLNGKGNGLLCISRSVLQILDMTRMEKCFSNTYVVEKGEPTIESIDRAMQFARGVQPDFLVAIGGGSCLDTTKT